MLENRRWLVIPTNLTGSINFNQVVENDFDSLRISTDGSKTFIKYDVQILNEDLIVDYVDAETGDEKQAITPKGIYGRPSIYSEELGEYTYEEILELLSGPEWTREPETR